MLHILAGANVAVQCLVANLSRSYAKLSKYIICKYISCLSCLVNYFEVPLAVCKWITKGALMASANSLKQNSLAKCYGYIGFTLFCLCAEDEQKNMFICDFLLGRATLWSSWSPENKQQFHLFVFNHIKTLKKIIKVQHKITLSDCLTSKHGCSQATFTVWHCTGTTEWSIVGSWVLKRLA